MNEVTINNSEGWDARSWDTKHHYFVNNKALCGKGKYHPPYFNKNYIPDEDEYDYYCKTCSRILKNVISKVKRLDQWLENIKT